MDRSNNLNFKKILLLCLPMVFALTLAITLAACMAQANLDLDSSLLGEETTGTPPQNPEHEVLGAISALEFASNGDGTCSVLSIGGCTDSYVEIPEYSPDGDLVTAIEDSAFFGCGTLKEIALPKSVKKIGDYAFYGSSLKSINLSESITHIGECAFSNCMSLTMISVDPDCKNYSSLEGVLFSKDKTELICYPSGKTNSSYTIRSSVKKIAKMAFYNCDALETVNYNGTKEQWEEIEIASGNDSLEAATVKFPSSKK